MEIYVFTWMIAFLEQQQQQRSDARKSCQKAISLFLWDKNAFNKSLLLGCSFHLNQCQSLLICGEFFHSIASEFVRGKKDVLALERMKLLSHKTTNDKIQWFSVFLSISTHLQFHESTLITVFGHLCLWHNFKKSLSI